MFRQVCPPSSERNTPVPGMVKFRAFLRLSPEPSQMTSGFEGASAISPIPSADWFSKIGFQVRPWFVVFHKFPEPNATYIVPGRPGSHWTASTLAEFMTGPIETHFRSNSDSFFSFKYCSHESRRGLLSSWPRMKRQVPAQRKINAKVSKCLIFIS